VCAPKYWDWGDDDKEFKYNNYLGRYHTRHLDIMDVLSMYQPRAYTSLDAMARLCGFPGKLGVGGANVYAAVQAGRIEEVRRYCETDVMNTYLLYLRFRLIRGTLAAGEYAKEVSMVREKIGATGAPHWQQFLAAWGSQDRTNGNGA
jgi:3'-5' exonuclease